MIAKISELEQRKQTSNFQSANSIFIQPTNNILPFQTQQFANNIMPNQNNILYTPQYNNITNQQPFAQQQQMNGTNNLQHQYQNFTQQQQQLTPEQVIMIVNNPQLRQTLNPVQLMQFNLIQMKMQQPMRPNINMQGNSQTNLFAAQNIHMQQQQQQQQKLHSQAIQMNQQHHLIPQNIVSTPVINQASLGQLNINSNLFIILDMQQMQQINNNIQMQQTQQQQPSKVSFLI
jgi:hypothetical protein